MLDTRTAKKEIVLTLTNNSTSEDSTVSLFSLGSTSSSTGSPTAFGQSIGINSTDFPTTNSWIIRFYAFGETTLTNDKITDPTDIDDLITKLNATFGAGVFWYEAGTGGFTYTLLCATSLYTFYSIIPTPKPERTFTTSTTEYISATSVQVSVGYGVSYNAICTDLTTQPYLLTSMYVSSTSQSQTTQQLTTSIIGANGVARSKPIQPVTDPNQSQNVQMAIPIFMPTSAMNELQYTLLAGQSATVIVRYENVELFDALELINSGEFQREMDNLRAQDQKEYERIMETVKGYNVIANAEHPKSWVEPPVFPPAPEPKPVFAVPLIYAVAKENGNFFVQML